RVDNNLHRIVLLKDEIGRFYYPQGRFCNIPYWDLTRGYFVKALSAVEVEWTGEPVEPYADVPLHRGWNIAAYYPFYNLSAAAPGFDVISTIIDNVLIAKNAEGRFIWPLRGFSNMPPWTPGQGYLVKAANDVVLNYPYPAQRFNSLPGEAPLAETAHFRFTSRTGDFLPVLVLGLEVAGRQAEEGDEIGVFDGDTLCIGGGVWTGEMPLGFAAWRDDETTPAIDGYRNSRNITFRFWDRSENEEIRPNGTRTAGADLQNDGSIWAGDLTFDGPVSRPEIPKEFKLGPIFPNPFNSNTIIGYALPVASDVNLSLFDLNGRKVADIYRGFCEPGSYRLPYNAVKIPSGIYVLKMATAEYISTTKLEILR
ncbi:MAG: T9SS type A sorting domain-containing protein, partial [Calditrichaeota bacterium]|nr:T9SS type A sorting domain-containing protein [Calditrichota bacterium]